MNKPKSDSADKLTPLAKFADDSYSARCKLKFAMSVFRELALGNVDQPEFSNDELNGLTFTWALTRNEPLLLMKTEPESARQKVPWER